MKPLDLAAELTGRRIIYPYRVVFSWQTELCMTSLSNWSQQSTNSAMLHAFKHQNNFVSLVAIYHAGHQIVLASPYSDYYQCSPQYIHTKSVITVVSARSELLKQLHQEAIQARSCLVVLVEVSKLLPKLYNLWPWQSLNLLDNRDGRMHGRTVSTQFQCWIKQRLQRGRNEICRTYKTNKR
jgi:hypothetical protein